MMAHDLTRENGARSGENRAPRTTSRDQTVGGAESCMILHKPVLQTDEIIR